jgi:hypothetical protein
MVTEALQKVSYFREHPFRLLSLVSGAQAVLHNHQLLNHCPPHVETSMP